MKSFSILTAMAVFLALPAALRSQTTQPEPQATAIAAPGSPVRDASAPASSEATSPLPAARATLALVPYEEPDSKDPHGPAITQSMLAALQSQGVPVAAIDPMDHIAAVAQAGRLCATRAAAALLIPEGRYEQTRHVGWGPFGMRFISYPAHVEFRLDEIDCHSTVVWSAKTVADKSISGVGMNLLPGANVGGPSNVESAIDDAFRTAIASVAADFKTGAPPLPMIVPTSPSPVPSTNSVPSGSEVPASPTALPSAEVPAVMPSVAVLLPFAQPGIADPRSADMADALKQTLKDHGTAATLVEPVDRLTAVTRAPQLCAQYNSGAVFVPEVRLEQTGHTFAELRIGEIACDGTLIATGTGTAEVGNGGANAAAAMVEAAQKAASTALQQLHSETISTSTTPSPAPTSTAGA